MLGLGALIEPAVGEVVAPADGEISLIEGDRIKRGQPLISFDKDFITSKGYPIITPVIISNADDYKEIKITTNDEVKRIDEVYFKILFADSTEVSVDILDFNIVEQGS